MQAGDKSDRGWIAVQPGFIGIPSGSSIKDLDGNHAIASWQGSHGARFGVDGSSAPTSEPDDECETGLAGDSNAAGIWTDGCASENREGRFARYYTFTLTQEAEVTITLESAEDPVLYLLEDAGRYGAALCENDDYATGPVGAPCGKIGSGLASSLDSGMVANLGAGAYTIEATTFNARATGEFTLAVRRDLVESMDPGQDIEIDTKTGFNNSTIVSFYLKPLEPETAPYRTLEIAIEDDIGLDDREFGEMAITLPETAWVDYEGIKKWVKINHDGDERYFEYTQELEDEMIREHYESAGAFDYVLTLLKIFSTRKQAD